MREIKFRAFHKGRKEMYNVFSLAPDYVFKDTLDGVGNPGCPDKTEEVRLMQFTGLYDRKGVEIYEGDIVKAGEQTVGVVVWNNEMAYYDISVQYKNEGYTITPFSVQECGLNMNREVVGNIYQNPEILERTK